MVKHGEVIKRTINVVNLDPAAEHFDYPVYAGNTFRRDSNCSKTMPA